MSPIVRPIRSNDRFRVLDQPWLGVEYYTEIGSVGCAWGECAFCLKGPLGSKSQWRYWLLPVLDRNNFDAYCVLKLNAVWYSRVRELVLATGDPKGYDIQVGERTVSAMLGSIDSIPASELKKLDTGWLRRMTKPWPKQCVQRMYDRTTSSCASLT